MADSNAEELQKREARAFSKKAAIDALNQELALAFYPERADFTTERALGEEFAADLFDSEPMRCRRQLGDARQAMLRPRSREWCRAETDDDDLNKSPAVEPFLDWLNKRFRAALYRPATGFVRAEKEADQDIVTFGAAIQTAESEISRDGKRVPMVRDWHPRDCAWFDDATGVKQDVMFRRFKASARHIKQKFPEAQLHDAIKRALEEEPDREFQLCHTMMPAAEYSFYKKPRGRKAPFVSVYYDSEHKMLLRERPSARFRYVVKRWGTISGSQYPYSPAAMTALPDGRGIQTMAMVLLESGEKALDPPKTVVRGAVIGEINDYASGITWIDGEKYNEKMGPAIAALTPNDRNLAIGIDLINRTTFALRDTWYLTKLNLPQIHEKTAYEASLLNEEFIRANVPLFEPWEADEELTLDEIFGVLFDMGEFGPVEGWPKELSGRDLVWKFSNDLQDAIDKLKTGQFTSALGLAAGVKEIDPNALRRIDWGRGFTDAVRGNRSPADWIRDEKQVEAEDQHAAQVGDIVGGLAAAGQAAEVVRTGTEAAANLQGAGLLGGAPVDGAPI